MSPAFGFGGPLLLLRLRSRCRRRRRLRRGLVLLLRLRRGGCRHLVADLLLLLLVGRLLDGLLRGLVSGLLCGLLSGLLSSLLCGLLSSLLSGLLGSFLLQLLLHRPAVRLLGRAQSGPLLVARRSWNRCVRLCLAVLLRLLRLWLLLFFHG